MCIISLNVGVVSITACIRKMIHPPPTCTAGDSGLCGELGVVPVFLETKSTLDFFGKNPNNSQVSFLIVMGQLSKPLEQNA